MAHTLYDVLYFVVIRFFGLLLVELRASYAVVHVVSVSERISAKNIGPSLVADATMGYENACVQDIGRTQNITPP